MVRTPNPHRPNPAWVPITARPAATAVNSLPRIHKPLLRRAAMGALLLSAAVVLSVAPAPAQAIELRDVAALAKQRAAEPYRAPTEIPAFLQELSYEQARLFRFLPERRLWRATNSQFQASFIAPARHQRYPVKIRRVTAEGVRDIPFDREQFDFGDPDLVKRIPPDLGYAGLRLSTRSTVPASRSPWSNSAARVIFAVLVKVVSPACGRAGWRSTPACRAVRSFRCSVNSGWSSHARPLPA